MSRTKETGEARVLSMNLEEVGKRVRASKKRLTFKFCFLGGEQHAIQLVHSVMSGKKVVIADGMTLLEVKEKVVGEWRYPFQFRGHLLSVVIDGQEHEYDLLIDGVGFRDLERISFLDMRAAAQKDKKPSRRASRSRGSSGSASGGVGAGKVRKAPRDIHFDEFVKGGGSGSPGAVSGSSDFSLPAPAQGGTRGRLRTRSSGTGAMWGSGSTPAPAPAPAPASGGGGGGFDPFGDSNGASNGGGAASAGGGGAAGAGALWDDVPPAPAPTTATSAQPQPQPQAAAFDPFGADTPAPAPAPAQAPAPAPAWDEFGTAAAPAPTASASPLAGHMSKMSFDAPADAVSPAVTALKQKEQERTPSQKDLLSLVNMDRLTEAPPVDASKQAATAAAPRRRSLAELKYGAAAASNGAATATAGATLFGRPVAAAGVGAAPGGGGAAAAANGLSAGTVPIDPFASSVPAAPVTGGVQPFGASAAVGGFGAPPPASNAFGGGGFGAAAAVGDPFAVGAAAPAPPAPAAPPGDPFAPFGGVQPAHSGALPTHTRTASGGLDAIDPFAALT